MQQFVDGLLVGVPPDEAASIEAEWAAVLIPTSVSARQAKLALSQAGLYAAVKTAVAGADEATQIWWDTSQTWERANPVLLAMQAGLGWPDAEVDALFQAAAALP